MRNTTKQTQLQHLLWRAGFGENAERIKQLADKPLRKVVNQLFEDAERIEPLRVVSPDALARREVKQMADLSPDEVKDLLKAQIAQIRDLNVAWIDRMATTQAPLREKMTLFWHGHFACRGRSPQHVQTQNNTLRQHALGKFGDLLMAIAKDPAMLQFLNNQQNRKKSPNENFARELLELFTLGRGHYTEADIKNAARAFTGWGFDLEGNFVFRRIFHDDGTKTFMGQTGQFGGEDIIRIVLEKEQTARFITSKILKFFVNENPDNQLVDTLAKRFYRSGYDIADLMKAIFAADWFYATLHVGTHLKSPVELLVGLTRTTGLNFDNKQSVMFIQRVLGQTLFYPPSVAGWSGGRTWIDSSSLLFRMRLPEVAFNAAAVTVAPKDDGDVNTELLSKRAGKVLNATANWSDLERIYGSLAAAEMLDQLAVFWLQTPLRAEQKKLLLQRSQSMPNTQLVKGLSIALMTLPEYQLS
jgi:uncharacterized protein (DUF1800 family)